MKHIEFICYKCRKKTSETIELFHDSSFGSISSLPTTICNYCGAKGKFYGPFVYACRDRNILYINISSYELNQFEWNLHMVNSIIDEYLSTIEPAEQNVIMNMERRYVESELFSSVITDTQSTEPIIGLRKIRFTPALKIQTSSEYQFSDKEANFELSKNEIGYINNGISPLYEAIFKKIEEKLLQDKFILSLKEIDVKQHAVATHELPDIILVVATAVILPVLTNCLADIIYDLRHGTINKKSELEKDDYVKIKIKIDKSKTMYYFEGYADAITNILRVFSETLLPTLNIPNNCHTECIIDNVISCQLAPHSIKILSLRDAAEEFAKYFDTNSSVEIMYDNNDDDYNNEEMVSHKAKKLMDNDDFENAYWILFPHMGKAETIEYTFNLAYCSSKLGEKEEANKLFYEVIRKYLLCMDLTDLGMFKGNDSPEFIEMVNEKVLTLGIPFRDTEGNTHYPTTEKDIDASATVNTHNRLLDECRNFELDDLRREARLNKELVLIKYQIHKCKKALNEIIGTNNNIIQKDIDEINNTISELQNKKSEIIHKLDKLQRTYFISAAQRLLDDEGRNKFDEFLKKGEE